MVEHVIIAGSREELDKLPCDQPARASAIIVAEPDGRWQVVKTRYTAHCGAVFANRGMALRAVLL
jgi:hypothetical protein